MILEMLMGKPTNGYREMPTYIHMLNTLYPNSYIRMHKLDENEFMYLFIVLRPLMRGYQFCRPIVVVDGAHLSGSYKGTFLSASKLDSAGIVLFHFIYLVNYILNIRFFFLIYKVVIF